ncbi:MAG: hypothetical protein U9Q72_01530 [Patescibacteria group bacterium]|nr:hypothetical protein [Patescibacteria group bacterium]
MSSGAEFKFKKDIQKANDKLDPESQMSSSEINQQARKEAREYRDYSKDQIKNEQNPMSAKEITKLSSEETRQLNRDAGTKFTE